MFYWFKYSWSYESKPEALKDVPLIKDIVEASWIAGFSQQKRSLKSNGIATDIIAKCVGLPLETVMAL